MSRYIDTDEIKRQWDIYGSFDVMDRILADVFPIVDAVPVVHGHWEYIGGYGYQYRCSKCFSCASHKTNFCPHCGALMNEVTE